MLVGGLVAGQGQIDLFVLIAIVWAAAVAGDVTSYTLGRRLGRNWLLRHGERLKITEERLHQVETFFEKRGGLTILIGRFIGLVRALAPFIAGTSKMPLRQFLPYDVIGAGAWATTFCVLGYVFWQSFDRLTQYVSRGLFAFGTVVAVGLGLYFLVRLRNDPGLRRNVHAWLHEREDKAWVRLVLKVAGPAWRMFGRPAAGGLDATARFGLGRLTPGHLGLELTTLIAIAGVGALHRRAARAPDRRAGRAAHRPGGVRHRRPDALRAADLDRRDVHPPRLLAGDGPARARHDAVRAAAAALDRGGRARRRRRC